MKGIFKYLPWVLVLLFFLGTTYYYWNSNRQTMALLQTKTEELMKANLAIGRAETKLGDANLLISKLNKQIQEEIKARKALLTLYAELEVLYKAEKEKVKTITQIVYKDRIIDLPKGKIFIRQEDGTYEEVKSILYSYKDFRLSLKGDAIQQTLSYNLTQRFKIIIAESKLPSGGFNHYAELYELDDKNNIVGQANITSFQVVKSEELKSKMFWWNPKLDISIGGVLNQHISGSWMADLGFTLSSYGKTPNDITWKFLKAGIGFTRDGLLLSFSPAQYNIGQNLPLISNLFITPFAGYDFGARGFLGGLSLGVVL